MKQPTPEQVAAEIQWLETNKMNVRHCSAFGDDHWNAIEAQIEALKGDFDESECYARYEASEDDDADMDEMRAENVLNAALDAINWRDGEEEMSPSANWTPLLKPTPQP